MLTSVNITEEVVNSKTINMRKTLAAAIVLVLIPTSVYAWTKRKDAHGKTLIAYYASW
jgi:hypothetical protein